MKSKKRNSKKFVLYLANSEGNSNTEGKKLFETFIWLVCHTYSKSEAAGCKHIFFVYYPTYLWPFIVAKSIEAEVRKILRIF